MNNDEQFIQFVKIALDRAGVRLLSESEYAEAALRLATLLAGVRTLLALPNESEVLLPPDLPLPSWWSK